MGYTIVVWYNVRVEITRRNLYNTTVFSCLFNLTGMSLIYVTFLKETKSATMNIFRKFLFSF